MVWNLVVDVSADMKSLESIRSLIVTIVRSLREIAAMHTVIFLHQQSGVRARLLAGSKIGA